MPYETKKQRQERFLAEFLRRVREAPPGTRGLYEGRRCVQAADVVSIDELRAAREAALVRDNNDDEGEDTCGWLHARYGREVRPPFARWMQGCLCAKAAQRDKSAAALLLDERVPLDDRFEIAARILYPVHVATGRHADVVSIDELRAAREAALVRDNDDDEGEDTCG